jgi:fibronectin-binding autotransporter adhesin
MNNKPNYNFSLRKLLVATLAIGPLAVLPAPLWALPTAGQLSGTINATSSGVSVVLTNSTLLTVTSPDKGIVDWNDFGAGNMTIISGDTINYVLPTASSAVLNRIIGANPTSIAGTISSNGKVSVLNPNGITLAGTAIINTAGFTASTIAEPDSTFAATGALSFIGTPQAGVTVTTGAQISTIGGSGDVLLAGTTVNVAGTVTAANLNIRSSGAVSLGQGGVLNVNATAGSGGNVSVTSNGAAVTVGSTAVNVQGNLIINSANPVSTTTGGAVVLSSGAATSVGGDLSVTTGGGAVQLSNNAGNTVVGGNATINTSGTTSGAVTTPIGAFNVNTSGKSTTINAGNATVTVVGNSRTISVTGNTTSITDADDIAIGASSITGAPAGLLTVVSTAGNITNSGTVALTSTTTVAPSISLTATTPSKSITFSGSGPMTFSTLATDAATGNVTITGTGNITLPAITAGNVSVTTTGGTITEASALTNAGSVTLSSSSDLTVAAVTAPTISLTSTGGAVSSAALAGSTAVGISAAGNIATTGAITGGNVTISSTGGSLTAGTAITATTATSVTTQGDISLGAVTSPALTLKSNGGSILQTGAFTSSGTTTLTAANAITLANAGNDFGTVLLSGAASGASITDATGIVIGSSAVTGNTTITTTNGAITLGSALTDSILFGGNLTLAAGTGGAITDAANNIKVNGALTMNTTGAVTIDNTGGQFGQVNSTGASSVAVTEATTLNLGNITTAGTLTATSTGGDIINTGTLAVTGASSFTAGNLAVPGDITLGNTSNSLGGLITIGSAKNLTISNAVATSVATLFPVSGNATFTVGGTAAFTATTVDFNTFGGTFGGAVTVTDNNDITVQNLNVTGSGAVTVTALGTTSGGNLRLGSGINIATTSATPTTFTATNNPSGNSTLTDTGGGIFIYGPVSFVSGTSVTINRAGHNFGAVSITTANNGAANIVESGTLKLSGVTVAGKGNLTATSTNGDIIQAGAITSGNDTTTFSALNGSVTLDQTGGSNQFNKSNVNISARNGATLNQTPANDVNLGNVTVSAGNLSVDASGGSSKISQASNTTIRVYGATSFKTAGAGNITIANTGNNFGPITLTGGNVTQLKESGTLNVAAISGQTGNVSLTSENGNIINSGAVATTAPQLNLTASNGSIDLSNSGNTFTSKLLLNASGDVNVASSAATIVLQGGTSIGGALTVTGIGGAGGVGGPAITDNGTLTVNGNTSLLSANGSINISDNNNRFGGVRFVVGTGGATIVESGTFNLRAGSVATGAVTITTGGDFITSGTGGSSFTNSLTINAVGNITPGAGSLLVVGTFTVNASGTKDLHLLSQSGNLAGNTPVNLGAGTYVAPAP